MFTANSIFAAKSGGAEMIAGGSIVAMDPESVELGLPMGDDFLILTLKFCKEGGKPGTWSFYSPDDPRRCSITFHSLEAPLGGGPGKPVNLWRTDDGLTISVILRIYTATGEPPLIHFTFYRKAEDIDPALLEAMKRKGGVELGGKKEVGDGK